MCVDTHSISLISNCEVSTPSTVGGSVCSTSYWLTGSVAGCYWLLGSPPEDVLAAERPAGTNHLNLLSHLAPHTTHTHTHLNIDTQHDIHSYICTQIK